MKYITPTIYGGYVNSHLLFNKPLPLVENSTVNERFQVQAGVAPSNAERVKIGYLGIGIGALAYSAGSDGLTITEYKQHEATDVNLFKPVPFVLRPITNDLSSALRANYAIRKQVEYSGTQYYAYYLKRIDASSSTVTMSTMNVTNGVTTITEFVPNSSNLSPTPKTLSTTAANTVDGDYVVASLPLDLGFTQSEVEEIVNAIKIIYGSDAYAKISEMAICSGVDRVVTGTSNGSSINYSEAIAAQVHTFYTTEIPLVATSQGYESTVDVGMTSPLFRVS